MWWCTQCPLKTVKRRSERQKKLAIFYFHISLYALWRTIKILLWKNQTRRRLPPSAKRPHLLREAGLKTTRTAASYSSNMLDILGSTVQFSCMPVSVRNPPQRLSGFVGISRVQPNSGNTHCRKKKKENKAPRESIKSLNEGMNWQENKKINKKSKKFLLSRRPAA